MKDRFGYLSKTMAFVLMGLHLAVLQVSIYFAAQCFITATFMVYFVVLSGWMAGSIFCLKYAFPEKLSTALFVSIGAYYLLIFMVRNCYPGLVLYAPVLGMIFIVSFPAGAFFRVWARKCRVYSLFCHENNGFVAGYVLSMAAFVRWGVNFIYIAPLVTCVFALLSQHIVVSMRGNAKVVLKSLHRSVDRRLFASDRAVLYLSGFNLISLQYIIVREFSSIISASELTILIVASTYLAGLSVGYGLSRYLPARVVRFLSPVMFFLHIVIFMSVKFIAGYYIRMGYNIETLVGLLVVASFCASAFYSIFLPRLIDLAGASSMRSYYSWNLLGALSGGAFIFFAVARAPGLLWPVYFVLFFILTMIIIRRSVYAGVFAVAAVSAVCFVTLNQGDILRLTAEDYYQTRGYSYPELLFSKNSFYHSIDILDSHSGSERDAPGRRTAFINGVRYFDYGIDENNLFSGETSLSEFTYFLAELPTKCLYEKLGRKLRILVLGGGSMYSAARIDKYSAETILVEIDPIVVESAKKYWSGINKWDHLANLRIVIDDAKHYLRTTKKKFDLIIMDISAPYYLGTRLLHNRSFFSFVKRGLAEGGIFSESTQGRPKSSRKNSMSMRIMKGIEETFDFYNVIDCRESPRGRRGFLYASKEQVLSSERIVKVMERDGMYDGVGVNTSNDHNIDLSGTTAYSLTNMRGLFKGNRVRMNRRMRFKKRQDDQEELLEEGREELEDMDFRSIMYLKGLWEKKQNRLILFSVCVAMLGAYCLSLRRKYNGYLRK